MFGELRPVAKAAGVRHRADGLAYAQLLPAVKKARGVIQTSEQMNSVKVTPRCVKRFWK
jgi:hypothetical protein